MVMPLTAGLPGQSDTYAIQKWVPSALEKFFGASTFAAVTNTKYEGVIKNSGDTVYVRTIPDMEVWDYVAGQNVPIQYPQPGKEEMLIDQGKGWAFGTDDVQEKQADVPFREWFKKDAGAQLAKSMDETLLAYIYQYANAYNKGLTAGVKSGLYNLGVSGTPFNATKANIIQFIVAMNSAMSEHDVDKGDRWVVLSEIFQYLLMASDLKNASLMGDGSSILRNGNVGKIANMNLFFTNRLTLTTDGTDTVHNVIAGTTLGCSFATQLNKVDVLQNQKVFGWIIRGLQIFGRKAFQPKCIVHGYAKASV